MYRLLADILNDFAFILDCLSPAFPKPIRVIILSFSSVLRALCGVAAGSAKASLSAHFARWGNLGELNAKDSSQETVISLLGMLAGSLVVSWVETQTATWTVLILLLSVHLETNRRAVRAVSMRTLSRQRATLLYHQLQRGIVAKPEDISKSERIFDRDGVLRDVHGSITGWCAFESSIKALFDPQASMRRSRTGSLSVDSLHIERLLAIFEKRRYIVNVVPASNQDLYQCQIFLKRGATTTDCLTAWWHCLAFVEAEKALRGQRTVSEVYYSPAGRKELLDLLEKLSPTIAEILEKRGDALRAAGWDLEVNALETGSSMRLSFND